MEPIALNITIWQGATWEKTWTFAKGGAAWPTGSILARAQVRDEAYDVKLADFACSVVTTATKNTVTISMSAITTAALTPGRGTWDMELYREADGYVWKPYAGKVTVKAEATK